MTKTMVVKFLRGNRILFELNAFELVGFYCNCFSTFQSINCLEPFSISRSKTDPEERKKLVQERRLATKLAREQYSLRMSCLYKLSVANHFRYHVFWLPINLDFRGRVYPIPPHCSHVGKDGVFCIDSANLRLSTKKYRQTPRCEYRYLVLGTNIFCS